VLLPTFNALTNALSEGRAARSRRDRPANAATLADWIYQCRRAGLYDLGRILYEKGGLRLRRAGRRAAAAGGRGLPDLRQARRAKRKTESQKDQATKPE